MGDALGTLNKPMHRWCPTSRGGPRSCRCHSPWRRRPPQRRTGRPLTAGGAPCPNRSGGQPLRSQRRGGRHQRKLIRRHPHVFSDAVASDSAAVKETWEAIKATERGEQPPSASPLSDALAAKVRGMPALAGAMTISKKGGESWLRVGRHGRSVGQGA
jgi:hypothetical protein